MAIVAIDFETANESRSSACAIGLAWIEDGAVTRTEARLIRPASPRFTNSWLHGITWDDVRTAPEFPDVMAEFMDDLHGGLVLAHNASFDMSVIRHVCADYGIPAPVCDYLCTVNLSRHTWPELYSHKLNVVSEFLGIALKHHDAHDDARACAHIAVAAGEVWDCFDLNDIPKHTPIRLGRLFEGGYEPCRAPRLKRPVRSV